MNTCDKCKHYTAPDPGKPWLKTHCGKCALSLDANDYDDHPLADRGRDAEVPQDRVMGWDYESYKAGVYVGPKFGCIHWEGKE